MFCEQEKKLGNRLEGDVVGLGVNSQPVGIVLQNLLCLKVQYKILERLRYTKSKQ
jgi:hypothetical protein